jgi:hypothetical protein
MYLIDEIVLDETSSLEDLKAVPIEEFMNLNFSDDILIKLSGANRIDMLNYFLELHLENKTLLPVSKDILRKYDCPQNISVFSKECVKWWVDLVLEYNFDLAFFDDAFFEKELSLNAQNNLFHYYFSDYDSFDKIPNDVDKIKLIGNTSNTILKLHLLPINILNNLDIEMFIFLIENNYKTEIKKYIECHMKINAMTSYDLIVKYIDLVYYTYNEEKININQLMEKIGPIALENYNYDSLTKLFELHVKKEKSGKIILTLSRNRNTINFYIKLKKLFPDSVFIVFPQFYCFYDESTETLFELISDDYIDCPELTNELFINIKHCKSNYFMSNDDDKCDDFLDMLALFGKYFKISDPHSVLINMALPDLFENNITDILISFFKENNYDYLCKGVNFIKKKNTPHSFLKDYYYLIKSLNFTVCDCIRSFVNLTNQTLDIHFIKILIINCDEKILTELLELFFNNIIFFNSDFITLLLLYSSDEIRNLLRERGFRPKITQDIVKDCLECDYKILIISKEITLDEFFQMVNEIKGCIYRINLNSFYEFFGDMIDLENFLINNIIVDCDEINVPIDANYVANKICEKIVNNEPDSFFQLKKFINAFPNKHITIDEDLIEQIPDPYQRKYIKLKST